MELSPRQSVNPDPFFVSGDVTIHPSAVIASGVLLQAEANSRIVIGAGVCIGTGSILHAYEGTLEVEEQVTLGAGVLILGHGKIASKACVGTTTTVFNHNVQSKQVISSQSVLGDLSRQLQNKQFEESKPLIESETKSKPSFESKVITESQTISISETSIEFESSTEVTPTQESKEKIVSKSADSSITQNEVESSETQENSLEKEQNTPSPSTQKSQVYGQVYLNQMLIKLLPHRQDLEDSSQDSDEG